MIYQKTHKNIFSNWQEAIKYYYSKGITDEFIPPTQVDENSIIKNNDGIIFFNFREERARQLTECFVNKNFNHFPIKNIKLTFFITPISYGDDLSTTSLFKHKNPKNNLMDILSKKGFTTMAIAETEKYAHVTYFFTGGRQNAYANETQILIPSIHAKNYVSKPCMSAQKITDTVIDSLKNDPKDFYLINYASADMVGHSGNFEATVKAIECLDKQLGILYKEIVEKFDGIMYITADHGNAEKKWDAKSYQPSTAHTTNPVPFIMLKKDLKGKTKKLPLKELADIKNFILKNI